MSKGKSCLWSCGIGCALLVLLGIGAVISSAIFVRGTLSGFENAIEQRETLEARFGEPESFTPWPDGTVPADRVEAFLRVREATQPIRQSLSDRFGSMMLGAADARRIEDASPMEKLRFAMGMGRNAMGLAPELGEFFEARNRALLDAEMGFGEYSWLYAIVYYDLLGHDPGDGPEALLRDDDDRTVEIDADLNSSMPRVRRELRRMLANQLVAVPDDPAHAEWRATLAAEVAALDARHGRLPWQDGLPQELSNSLGPYRERLEATYSAATNAFELSKNVKRGGFSIQSE